MIDLGGLELVAYLFAAIIGVGIILVAAYDRAVEHLERKRDHAHSTPQDPHPGPENRPSSR